jgi:hypothetical protein
LSSKDVPNVSELPADTLDPSQYENVLRFSGKWLSLYQAGRRQRLYTEVSKRSEQYLAAIIDGVRLTQRLGASTLPFRAFHGGNARIQAGRLGFVQNVNGEIVPRLLTSSSVANYDLTYVPVALRPFISSHSEAASESPSLSPVVT